jgi:hypothetical protein
MIINKHIVTSATNNSNFSSDANIIVDHVGKYSAAPAPIIGSMANISTPN